MFYKQVICVRDDLKLSPGKLAVQVAHGAVDGAFLARDKYRAWFSTWVREGQKKVCVKVPDERTLFELKAQAELQGLPACLIRDAGRTELPPETVTVLAIGPGPEALVDRVTGSLKLL